MAASPSPPRTGERIAKLLARAGVASRREVERMIAEGRIARDGMTIDTPATVLASLEGVTVDGTPVAAPAPARLFLYHKPPGLLVTERDPRGRPTIYDRLPAGLPRVVPVGRLDLATEGLLLLTTDGGLKRRLELPATGVARRYRARAYGPVSQSQLEALIEGVEIDGIRYGPIDANLERRTGANVWIELTLTEGKNREVRRVLAHLGLEVNRLIRTAYGPFVLGDLPPGAAGEVRGHDLATFVQSLGHGRGGDREMRVAVTPLAAAERGPAPAEPQRRIADKEPVPHGSSVADGRPSPAGRAGKAGRQTGSVPKAKGRGHGDGITPRTVRAAPPRSTGIAPASTARAAKPPSARKPVARPAATGPREDDAPARRSRPPQRKPGWARPKPRPGSGRPRKT